MLNIDILLNFAVNVSLIYMGREKIDVVIPWVDGNDPAWQAQKKQYDGIKSDDKSEARYRDWDNLQYLFRGIEKFWPWVNKVFLITCGQKPKWLNVQCEKLRLVAHADYMLPEYLPTFNSGAIEINLHKIEDLNEHFIYLNDDFFPIRPLQPMDFFVNGLPCDSAEQRTSYAYYTPQNNLIQYEDFTMLGLINACFSKRNVTRKHTKNWYGSYLGTHGVLQALSKAHQNFFTGFVIHHSAQPFLKSTFQKVWDKYPDMMSQTSRSKFRQPTDVNQWLVRYWQLAENTFHPYSMKNRILYDVSPENMEEVANAIRRQRYDIISINDNPLLSYEGFLQTKETINAALNDVLPNKSPFEI